MKRTGFFHRPASRRTVFTALLGLAVLSLMSGSLRAEPNAPEAKPNQVTALFGTEAYLPATILLDEWAAPSFRSLNSASKSYLLRDDRTKEPVSHQTVTPSDLRLSPVLPGPRYITASDMNNNGWNSGFMHTLSTNPGYAFLASAVIPGLGQAANRQWWKTALFVAVEATAIGVYIHRENRGRDGERYYEEFGNENWSVVAYAQFLVEKHGNQHGKSFRDLLTDEGINLYRDGEDPFGGIQPAFDINVDWDIININALRQAERNSFYGTGFAFSHDLPDYGSQQYYELMSKYFQFGPGWREWFHNDPGRFSIDDGIMPEQFWYHAQVGFDFNDDLSVARNMLTLLVTNHFVAAFDAYFTQKLRAARMQPTASMEYGLRPTIGMQLRF